VIGKWNNEQIDNRWLIVNEMYTSCKLIMEQHTNKCLDICNCLLSQYHEEGGALLCHHTITGDEIWNHHYEPESKDLMFLSESSNLTQQQEK
jgi:hypothetical protein